MPEKSDSPPIEFCQLCRRDKDDCVCGMSDDPDEDDCPEMPWRDYPNAKELQHYQDEARKLKR